MRTVNFADDLGGFGIVKTSDVAIFSKYFTDVPGLPTAAGPIVAHDVLLEPYAIFIRDGLTETQLQMNSILLGLDGPYIGAAVLEDEIDPGNKSRGLGYFTADIDSAIRRGGNW